MGLRNTDIIPQRSSSVLTSGSIPSHRIHSFIFGGGVGEDGIEVVGSFHVNRSGTQIGFSCSGTTVPQLKSSESTRSLSLGPVQATRCCAHLGQQGRHNTVGFFSTAFIAGMPQCCYGDPGNPGRSAYILSAPIHSRQAKPPHQACSFSQSGRQGHVSTKYGLVYTASIMVHLHSSHDGRGLFSGV